eukprot:352743-Chlamydomonas_euryale.AAC.24
MLPSDKTTQVRLQNATALAAVPSSQGSDGDSVASAVPLPPPPLDAAAAKRRLRVLLADPSINICHLVTELSLMVGLPGIGQPPEAVSNAEASLKAALRRVVDPSGPAFRSLSNGLSAALLLHMLFGCGDGSGSGEGSSGGGSSVPDVPALVGRILGRLGAGILTDDVMALGAQLLALAGVSEGLHLSAVYEPLASLALEQHAHAVAAAAAAPGGGGATAVAAVAEAMAGAEDKEQQQAAALAHMQAAPSP